MARMTVAFISFVQVTCLIVLVHVRKTMLFHTSVSLYADTELVVRHNEIVQLDGSASYNPDLPDGAQTVGVTFQWSCRQDEQVRARAVVVSTR